MCNQKLAGEPEVPSNDRALPQHKQGPDFDLQHQKQAKQFWREAATTGTGVKTLGPCSSCKQRSGVGHAKITAMRRVPHAPWRNLPLPWDGMPDRYFGSDTHTAAHPQEENSPSKSASGQPLGNGTSLCIRSSWFRDQVASTYWTVVHHIMCLPPLPKKTKCLEAECV